MSQFLHTAKCGSEAGLGRLERCTVWLIFYGIIFTTAGSCAIICKVLAKPRVGGGLVVDWWWIGALNQSGGEQLRFAAAIPSPPLLFCSCSIALEPVERAEMISREHCCDWLLGR